MTIPLDITERDPLEALAEEFVARYRKGEAPSVAEYADRHPALADDIRLLFPAATLLEDLKGPPRPDPVDQPLPEQLGDYRIVREVGRGGMGVVYEAVQVSLGRRVALKVLPPGRLGPDLVERFRREARAAGRLHHTNIVPVFGVGEHEGAHYYVMQFIDARGLDRIVARLREGPPDGFPPFAGPGYDQHIARLILQVAEALAHAHAQGILHRDIKPANLLLDDHGQLWVTDFGLAKLLEHDDLTRPGEMAGTLRYSAPERFQGKSDARSDVFALGLTLYELCTLRPAYDEAEPGRLLLQAGQARYASPRAHNPALSRDLETVLLRALAPEPARRYPSAAALADDLRRFLEDRPVRARRAGRLEHAWRWCRRNPAVAALSAALLLVFAGGFAGVAWKWREASRNFAEARDGEEREGKERQRAEGNLDVALEAFDRIARQLALARPGAPLETDGEGTAPPPVVSPEVAALLQDLVLFYERFTAGNASDPRLQRATATALRRAGTIRHRLGEHAKAEEAYRRAIELLARCAGQEFELARAHNDLGVVLRGGSQLAAAQDEHRQALALLEAMLAAPAVRLEQAAAHHQIGAIEWRQMRPRPAERSHRAALALLGELVKEDPKSPEARHRLARVNHDLAQALLWSPDNRQEAIGLRLEALEVLEKLTADFPAVPDYRAELAEMLISFAPRLLLLQGLMPREVVKRLARGVELASELTAQHPTVPDYQSLLARGRRRLGAVQLSAGATDEALRNLRQSVELRRGLMARFPQATAHELPLAEARGSLGEGLLRQKGGAPEAEKLLRENVSSLHKLLTPAPRNFFVRGLLSRSYRALGQALLRQGKKADGERMLKQADKYRDKPAKP